MKLAVLNTEGKETKKVELNAEIFGIEPNDHAIYLDVKQYGANNRQGTHKAKERAEVKGSTRKIKKQKGTGTARAGDIKNPLFRGGGRVFGPRPKDYGFKLNKKVKVLARKSALSYKAKGNQITVVEDFKMDSPKTKAYLNIMTALKVADQKPLLVLGEGDATLHLSSRNIKGHKVVAATDLNTYDILRHNSLVISESALPVIEKTLNRFKR
ncbi:MAG: 50S ribosomal protein L4 [Cryomorphaceae bacterium]|nr:50S ribosomal protein L4 [Flavobacteriales bacterium]